MSRYLPQEIIRAKRDGQELDAAAIEWFIEGLTSGTIADEQVGAFAMAVFLRGMSTAESVALTSAMARSGTMLHWDRSDLPGPVVDKHSTGGVGDKVSLMLAPLVAACGAVVPMISGRGLGHTGGTLDKLESIPGYNATPTEATFRHVVRDVGCAVIGQTADLAPADRRLYSVRDVTATVESIPLITASILSKKLAAGLDALVMDVKFGSGAFMVQVDDSRELARSIVDVAVGAGLPTTAFLTDMNQVLGRTAGNALEIRETIDWLTSTSADARLDEVVYTLGAEMLVLGGLAVGIDDARDQLVRARVSGAAVERFARMVAALGGPSDIVERPDDYLARSPEVVPVYADDVGWVERVDARSVGLAIVTLGGGRSRADDRIDHSVGLTHVVGIGEYVGTDQPLAVVHARSAADADYAAGLLRAAIRLRPSPPTNVTSAPPAVVLERVTAGSR